LLDWRKFERIYRTTLPFIHPENQGKWTLRLAQYYNNFCKFYVKRYFKEQELLKQLEELKKTDTLPKEEIVPPNIQPGLHEIAKPHHIPPLDSPIKEAANVNGDNIDEKTGNNEVEIAEKKEIVKEGGEEEEDLEELVQELEHVIELEGEEEGDAEADEDDQVEEVDSEGEASTTSENLEDTTKGEEKKKKEALEKLEERSQYFLDDYCHGKFIEIMSFVLKNLLYSRDDEVNSFVSKTCRVIFSFKSVFSDQYNSRDYYCSSQKFLHHRSLI